jgi:hypothetical protein
MDSHENLGLDDANRIDESSHDRVDHGDANRTMMSSGRSDSSVVILT